jgi:hypothetical protein
MRGRVSPLLKFGEFRRNDVSWCAQLMARSEPWITLKRARWHC